MILLISLKHPQLDHVVSVVNIQVTLAYGQLPQTKQTKNQAKTKSQKKKKNPKAEKKSKKNPKIKQKKAEKTQQNPTLQKISPQTHTKK